MQDNPSILSNQEMTVLGIPCFCSSSWSGKMTEKGDYLHFMIATIKGGSGGLGRTLAGANISSFFRGAEETLVSSHLGGTLPLWAVGYEPG
jgi:hypothetical protein